MQTKKDLIEVLESLLEKQKKIEILETQLDEANGHLKYLNLEIASVIDDLQHAYSNNDVEYYYNTLCNNLEYQIQRYVYDKIFRPSPRMILDNRVDEQRRYNY